MTESLGNILNKKSYGEPPEIAKIKNFVREIIGTEPRVSIKSNTYFVTVPNASAAGALRVHIYKLERDLGQGKRVVLRIG